MIWSLSTSISYKLRTKSLQKTSTTKTSSWCSSSFSQAPQFRLWTSLRMTLKRLKTNSEITTRNQIWRLSHYSNNKPTSLRATPQSPRSFDRTKNSTRSSPHKVRIKTTQKSSLKGRMTVFSFWKLKKPKVFWFLASLGLWLVMLRFPLFSN